MKNLLCPSAVWPIEKFNGKKRRNLDEIHGKIHDELYDEIDGEIHEFTSKAP